MAENLYDISRREHGPNRPGGLGRPMRRAASRGIFGLMTPPRILLIDDHAIFRTGLRMLLGQHLAGAEIFEAASADAALQAAPEHLDAVLLDVRLVGLSGLESIALIRRRWPRVPIVMLSGEDDPQTVRQALDRGAAAFVPKARPAEDIVEIVRLVLSGEWAAPAHPGADGPPSLLTPRQCEVLDLLHRGLSNKLIARQLAVSENTVRRHVQDILEHFGAASRAEAVFEARRRGLVN